jgi:hypothetical protein
MTSLNDKRKFVLQDQVVKYLDRVITALCELYLYRFHKIMLSPMNFARPTFKHIFRWAADYDAQVPFPQDGMAVYYIGNWSKFDHESHARFHAEEYRKAMSDTVDVEVACVIVLRSGSAK